MLTKFCAILLSILCAFSAAAGENTIKGYRSVFKAGRDSSGNICIAIRHYAINTVTYFLLVNPCTLETSVAPAATLDFSGGIPADKLYDSPFVKALDRHTSPPFKLQNHGATHSDLPAEGLFLTVDMCPSKRPFERAFFETVAGLARQNGQATPVAIAMTGAWLQHHEEELAWIKREIHQRRLAVTWMNHSYNHSYDPKAPLERNFLLSPDTDFEREVLATEVLMLENGLIPSPFFRFPGLVADGNLLGKLRQLSLIPIGSDAWLAKGENPKKGSFVLVHGNGNEPQGIVRVLPLLKQNNGPRLLHLREAFASQGSGATCNIKE